MSKIFALLNPENAVDFHFLGSFMEKVRSAEGPFLSSKTIILAFLISAALVAPPLCHLIKIPVRAVLPMQWIVLTASLLYGWKGGLITGGLMPLFSFFLSGNPEIHVLPSIILELSTMGVAVSFLKEKTKFPAYLSIFFGIVSGHLMFLISAFISGYALFNMDYLKSAFLPGIPSTLLQIFLIPALISYLNNNKEVCRQ